MPINRAPFNALVDDSGNGLTGSIWNKAAIQSVLLDPIDATIDLSAWTLYTPTWTTTGVAPVLGNASFTGRYLLRAKTCFVSLRVTFGSTTTFGTGAFIFTLPFPAKSIFNPMPALLQDASFGAYMAIAAYYAGAQVGIFGVGAPNGINATLPFTWATNDYIEINGTYEVQ